MAASEGGNTTVVFAHGYAPHQGFAHEQLFAQLMEIHNHNRQSSDDSLNSETFDQMVTRFAEDNYYRMHYVALRFLGLI